MLENSVWEQRQDSWFVFYPLDSFPSPAWEARRALAFWERLIAEAERRFSGPVVIMATVSEQDITEAGKGPMRIGIRFDRFVDPSAEKQRDPVDFDSFRAHVPSGDLFDSAKSIMEEMAVRNGFSGANELMRMISSLDLSDPAVLVEYKVWQMEDGSKSGLLYLFPQLAKLASSSEGDDEAH